MQATAAGAQEMQAIRQAYQDMEVGPLEQELEALRRFLQAALKLEHATLPPYMTALYSLGAGVPWEVIEVYRSVLVEEMLHMVLAANVLNAIGGKPVTYGQDFMPDYPARLPYDVDNIEVSLLGFSHAAVAQGLAIERPKRVDPARLRQLAHLTATRGLVNAAGAGTSAVPEVPPGMTIGEFYHFIEGKLRAVVARYGPPRVFTGNVAHQIGPDIYYYEGAGNVVPVHDLDSAIEAMEVIRDQGEGASHGIWTGDRKMFHDFPEVAHYFRFNQLALGRLYVEGDTVASGPTGPTLEVPWEHASHIVANAKVSQYPAGSEVRAHADAFNRAYCSLLRSIDRAFNGQPNLLLGAVPHMLAIKDLAARLMRNPFPGREAEGLHAAPTFEFVAVD
uniref:ferritin-like domain-containing protein n=1 Tax=Cupriavidus yeoncheonensis TaxID=1462994 RepID=UPI003F49460E